MSVLGIVIDVLVTAVVGGLLLHPNHLKRRGVLMRLLYWGVTGAIINAGIAFGNVVEHNGGNGLAATLLAVVPLAALWGYLWRGTEAAGWRVREGDE